MRKNILICSTIIVFALCFYCMKTESVLAESKIPNRVVITSVKSIDYDSVKITWKKAKYAKKYKVYRATSKNGKYRLVRTTKSRSFTNNKLTTGKRYYYKVKAVNGSKSGRYSYKKSVVPTLNKVSLNKIAVKGEDYAKLTYKKVAGASGYQIYRSNSGKTGTFYKKGSTKYLSYKNTGLEADKGYYYKVRAYKKVSGKYKYGAFSSVRYVRTDDHNWVVETVVKEPTCTEEGLKEGVCSVCGEECTEVIEKSGCVWEPVTETIYVNAKLKIPKISNKNPQNQKGKSS